MLDIRQLRHFCAIVAEGQISRAAQRLNISQPTLSLSLKELEEQLGYMLVNRSSGKWQITEQGRIFYKKAQRILSLMEDLEENLHNSPMEENKIIGDVRLGCSGFCISFIRDMMKDLVARYPGIRIRLLLGDNIKLENLVQERILDLAIIQLPMIFGNCEFVPLQTQHFVTCWSPLLAMPPDRAVSLSELAAHPIMLARRWSNSGAYRPLMIAMQEKGLNPHIILDSPFASVFLNLLEELPAVAVMPLNEARRGNLPIREIESARFEFRSAVVWNKDMDLAPAARKTVELICSSQNVACHKLG